MSTSGIEIAYGNVAPEAKENFVPSVTDAASFVNLNQLQQYGVDFPNYANPCELYQTVLDGTAKAFPSAPKNAKLGLWSKQISKEDGTFATPIVLTLTASGQYSSHGITLTFDTYNNIYCNSLNIKWYRSSTLLYSIDYEPDNSSYFCSQTVENYDKVVITFNSMNMPYNRLKLCVIDYGYDIYFYGNELRSTKIIQEINPISSEISINTCDFTLDSKTDTEYSFQAKQPLTVRFNGELKATTFVKTSKRQAKRLWSVQSEDYIGLLDSIPFPGDIYVNKNAVELLTEIFTLAKVPFNISTTFSGVTVSGHIPYTTCRVAVMHIALAIGAVVDTSNSEFVEVYKLSDEITQTIPLNRIMQGQNFDDEETTTGVEVNVHTYKAITETVTAYEAAESGTGSSILVKFSEPLHTLSITNGTITKSTANYAIITANASCVLTGCKYEHITVIKRKNNPLVLASEVEKIAAIENATLVSPSNADAVLERCYSWLVKNRQTNLKIVEGKHITDGVTTYDQAVNVGEVITCETEYLGEITGRVIKETFNLNGGIIVKEAVLR